MVLINGLPAQGIDCSDRGFQYGDGLFETIPIVAGRICLLSLHLQRLKLGCEKLLIPCPDLDLLAAESSQLVDQVQANAILKIIVTRGVGGRGYRQPDTIIPTRLLSLHPFPEYPLAYQQTGVALRFCQTRLGINPSLAGTKHLNRLEQVLARAEWHDPAIQEGIMQDSLGRIIEGTMTNLFFIKDNIIYTSPVTTSGIAGIMRAQIMQLAKQNAIPLKCQYFTKDRLMNADEIFLTNSVIGIWPVSLIENKTFSIGSLTQQLMTWLEGSI